MRLPALTPDWPGLRLRCVTGEVPKIICLWAAFSMNLAPIESAICNQRGGKDFGQPASAGSTGFK
jgi:hypothetical protein